MDISKIEAKQILSDALDDKRFFCNDGHVLCNFEELGSYLENISTETFSFHVTADNNDFSNWVRDVVGDNELAIILAEATDQATAAKAAKERVKWLKKKAS